MKMYILVLDDVPTGFAVVSAAHASLKAHLAWAGCPAYDMWLKDSFRKVACKVSHEEWEQAKIVAAGHVIPILFEVVTESALGGRETAMALFPKPVWPEFFGTLKLYS